MIKALPSALAALSLSLLLPPGAGAAPDDPPSVKPSSGPWDGGDGFKFEKKQKKKRQALSGIACPANTSG